MRIFENLDEYAGAVGEELGVSDWYEVDQERVNMFADATGDHQWIHSMPSARKKNWAWARLLTVF